MGTLTLPSSGLVYVDTMFVIYSIELYPSYWPLLEPMWLAAKGGGFEIVSSELTLMETLIGPLKTGNVTLQQQYENALLGTDVRLFPISQPILRQAAHLRATTKLRTPDAIHAATALETGCVLFVTNDKGFKSIPTLPVVVLDDLIP